AEEELTRLRSQVAEMEQLRADLAEAEANSRLPEDRVVVSRKDKEELLRLRGEVSTLRSQAQQLSSQVQNAQTQAERAKAQAAEALQNADKRLASLQANNQQLQTAAAAQAQNNCINNLRQI